MEKLTLLKLNDLFYSKYPNSDLKILNTFPKNGKVYVLVSDEFGELEISKSHLLSGKTPSIQSAVDKNLYFKNKAKKIHNDKYDYSLVSYEKDSKKIKIICHEHGIFEQSPSNHLQNHGCIKCRNINVGKKFQKDINFFIEKAKKVHGDKYDYSLVDYKKAREKVTIVCPIHGAFNQTAASHLVGYGCLHCGYSLTGNYAKENCNGWNYSNWNKLEKNSKNFINFAVYIIKCWNEKEEFFKIGKTALEIDKRFKYKLPYNYKLIKKYTGSSKEMSILEKNLQKENKEFKYNPLIKFIGYSECFKQVKLI